MSIGDLIPILFILLFVSQFFQRPKNAPPRTPQPRAGGARPVTRQGTGAPPAQQGNTASGGSFEDELERMLRDARERVRRAAEADTSSSPSARPLISSDRDDGRLATPVASAPPPPAKIPVRTPSPAAAARKALARDLRTVMPGIEVERRAATTSAPALRMHPLNADSIREGFIWHVVLGEPRARRHGGGTSRR